MPVEVITYQSVIKMTLKPARRLQHSNLMGT